MDVYPLLLALSRPIQLYAENADRISARALLQPLSLVLGITLLVVLAVRLVFRDRQRGDLWQLALCFFVFQYSSTYTWLDQKLAAHGAPDLAASLGALAPAIAVLAWLPLRGFHLKGFPAETVLTLARFWCMVMFLSAVLAAVLARLPLSDAPFPVREIPPAKEVREKPDIFYIILDSYGREDVLKSVYEFDNRPFLDELRGRGFFVAERSCSNYSMTDVSLASSLNLDYLKPPEALLAPDAPMNRLPLREMMARPTIVPFLQGQGYRTVSISSGMHVFDHNRYDVVHDSTFNTLSSMTLSSTLPGQFLGDWQGNQLRIQILRAIDHIEESSRIEQPVFVAAHLFAPHFPWVFDSEGKPLETPGSFRITQDGDVPFAQKKVLYVDEIRYLNGRMLELADRIAKRPGRKAVILFQGDHGYGRWMSCEFDKHPQWERMAILLAARFPDEAPRDLDHGISPVNLLGLVLDHYFGTGLGRLPDRSFFSCWPDPYRFTEIPPALLEEKGAPVLEPPDYFH